MDDATAGKMWAAFVALIGVGYAVKAVGWVALAVAAMLIVAAVLAAARAVRRRELRRRRDGEGGAQLDIWRATAAENLAKRDALWQASQIPGASLDMTIRSGQLETRAARRTGRHPTRA